MPRYRFTMRDHDSFDDEDGVMLPDDLSAREHALGIIQELQKANEGDWAGYIMEVTRDGRLVWEKMAWIDQRQRRRSS
jgi:Domain of unknown function (DUF6894)